MLVDKSSEFYNRLMKSWLQENDIELHLTHNQGKFVTSERRIRTLKNKIYKYMTSISKTLHIDKLKDEINNYNNTCSTIKVKPVDVKPSTYIDLNKTSNKEDPKFEVGEVEVRLWKYKNIFAKGYTPNWSEEVLWLKKFKKNVLWIYVISDINSEEIVEKFYKKELQKNNSKRV